MSNGDLAEHKTALSAGEKLRVAHAYLIDGVPQDVIARLMGVNIGRVNEAITAIRAALNESKLPVSRLSGSQPPAV